MDEITWQQEAWLRNRGWHHTSDTIGCYWMWEKEIANPAHHEKPGVKRTYVVDTETATRIEDSLQREEYFDAHPEELED